MWSLYIEITKQIPSGNPIPAGGPESDLTSWLQLVVQGGAMALLAMLVVKAPGWLDNLVTRILNSFSNMQKEVIAGFQGSLKDLRIQGQQTITLLENHFHERNETLRLAIDNQSRQLSQEMREIVRLIERTRPGGSRRLPPEKKDDKDIN